MKKKKEEKGKEAEGKSVDKKSQKKGKSFIVTLKKDGDLMIRGDEKDIKKFINIIKNKGVETKSLEIHPCL